MRRPGLKFTSMGDGRTPPPHEVIAQVLAGRKLPVYGSRKNVSDKEEGEGKVRKPSPPKVGKKRDDIPAPPKSVQPLAPYSDPKMARAVALSERRSKGNVILSPEEIKRAFQFGFSKRPPSQPVAEKLRSADEPEIRDNPLDPTATRGIKRRQIGDVRFIATQIAKAAQARKRAKQVKLGSAAQKELDKEYGEPRATAFLRGAKPKPFAKDFEAPGTEGPTTGTGLQEILPSSLSPGPEAYEGALEDLKSNIRGSGFRPPIPDWKQKVSEIRGGMPEEPITSIHGDDVLASPLVEEAQKNLFRPKIEKGMVNAYLKKERVEPLPEVDDSSPPDVVDAAFRKLTAAEKIREFIAKNPNLSIDHLGDYFRSRKPGKEEPSKAPKDPLAKLEKVFPEVKDEEELDVTEAGNRSAPPTRKEARILELSHPTTDDVMRDAASQARTGFYPRSRGVPVQTEEQDRRILENYIPESESPAGPIGPSREFNVSRTPTEEEGRAIKKAELTAQFGGGSASAADRLRQKLGGLRVRRYGTKEEEKTPAISRTTQSGQPAVSFTPRKPVPKGRLPEYGKPAMIEELPVETSIPQALRQDFAELKMEHMDRPTPKAMFGAASKLRHNPKLKAKRAEVLAETRARGQASLQAGKLKALIEHLQKTGGIR